MSLKRTYSECQRLPAQLKSNESKHAELESKLSNDEKICFPLCETFINSPWCFDGASLRDEVLNAVENINKIKLNVTINNMRVHLFHGDFLVCDSTLWLVEVMWNSIWYKVEFDK